MQYIVHEKQGDSISTADSLDYKAICVRRQGILEVTTSVVVIDKAYVGSPRKASALFCQIYILYWQLSAPILKYWTNHDCQRSRFSHLFPWPKRPMYVASYRTSYVHGYKRITRPNSPFVAETQVLGQLPLHTKPSPLNSPPAYLFVETCSTRHFLRRG